MFRTFSNFVIILSVVIGSAGHLLADEGHPAFDMSTRETHWAFVPVEKPEVPETSTGTLGNPIYAFVALKLGGEGLSFNDPAEKRALIRRVTYDLTGLPPTYDEVRAFVADDSPESYTALVDRLLASPAYGERWARHWLDIARYADTKGIFRRGRYSFSYTYRDYVIDALNQDKPYDEFIVEQIAADQLELWEDKTALAAMGFLTLGRTFFGRKDFIIDDQIDVVTRGLQGLTVSCARCHDHKFDPIPIADYYSLHGIFNSSEDPEELPVIKHPEDEEAYQSFLSAQENIRRKIEEKTDEVIDKFLVEERSSTGDYLGAIDEGSKIDDEDEFKIFAGSKGINADLLRLWIEYASVKENREHPLLKDWFHNYAANDREAGIEFYNQLFTAATNAEEDTYEDIETLFTEVGTPLNPDREAIAVWIRRKIGAETGDIQGEIQELDWTHPGAPIRAHILADVENPKSSAIYLRGNKDTLGDEVPRQYLEILSGGDRKPYTKGSGRLQLAREIADPDNPLTARVFVNRLWGWHFGNPLVDTPSDFGVRTPEPVHIDLLNWLSASFVESGWSIKSLQRLIVLSDTYRQSSDVDASAHLKDPTNSLWHHFPRQRLDFESMRDTLLKVSGNLDDTMGGIQADIQDPKSNRRTVYSFIDRKDMPGIFRTFDHPSPEATSPARFETVVPQQALFLLNSPFMMEQARHLAGSSIVNVDSAPQARIEALYRNVFQREPTAGELADGLDFIRFSDQSSPDETGESSLDGWELYSQALLLSNELIFVD